MGFGIVSKVLGTLHPRQVQATIDGYTRAVALSWTIGSSTRTVANATFNTAYFAGRGRNGVDMPNQRSTSFDTPGLLCSNDGYVGTGRIYSPVASVGAEQCNPANGNQIYAQVFQETNGDFTVSLLQRDAITGATTAYLALHNGYQMDFAYRYDLHTMPTFGLISREAGTLPRPSAASALDKAEILTVTAIDTLSPLSESARLINGVFLIKVNNLMFDNLAGSGITVSGTTVTWNSGITGLVLNPGDRVIAYYKAARRY